MSQNFMLKSIACSALVPLAVIAGVSAAQAQAIEQKVALCKACHLPATLQSTSVIPNIWGQS
jgi:cytochrome c553